MADRVWVEMPAVGTGEAGDPVRAKYPIPGRAFLLHREGKVYVIFGDELAREDALQRTDCRRLMPDEAQAFENDMPFPIPPHLMSVSSTPTTRAVGLGDVVAWVTRRLGISECAACRQRKRWLNRVPVWGWWRKRPAET
jgi:hypothetical protein